MNDVAARLANRIQLTTDGYKPYLVAVADAFDGVPIDYAMLVKIYNEPQTEGNEKRYSPPASVAGRGKRKSGVIQTPSIFQPPI